MDVPIERALAAIVAVAARLGLPTDRPRVVRDLTNVLVHLEPAPVVARVPVTLARLRGPEWFAQTLALARFLADAGAPVAPPVREVDPGPHPHDGLVVELWEYVDHDPARFEAAAAGRSLRDVHDALAGYAGALPPFDRLAEVGRLLETLAPTDVVSDDDLHVLREAHARLEARPAAEGRPLHGDAHFGNILWSPAGPLWTDLENACSGPVEYDLAALVWRRREGTREAVAAYGSHDADTVQRVIPALALFLTAWTIPIVERDGWSAGGRAELARRLDSVRAWLG